MRRWWMRAATALLLLALVVAAVLAAAWTALDASATTIWIEGERFAFADLSGGQAVAAFAIAVLAIVLALVLAALAVAVGLAVGAFGIVIGVLATAASLALVASPFLLAGWLVWRLVRRSRPAVAPGVPA